jgi:hypothetical protein
MLASRRGSKLVVGSSYAGEVLTVLATDARNVTSWVYVAAFRLDPIVFSKVQRE